MAILIFANGDEPSLDWIRPYLVKADLVIAADGGLKHLIKLGYPPDIVIGDLDSTSVAELARLHSRTKILSFPAAKDETDLELALLHAINNYESDILVFGAFGGRLDQTLANILLLAHPKLQDQQVKYLSEYESAWIASSETRVHGEVGDRLSLVPLGGNVRVSSTNGLQWALADEELRFGPARGISNVLVAPEASINVTQGMLLCIHAKQEWQR